VTAPIVPYAPHANHTVLPPARSSTADSHMIREQPVGYARPQAAALSREDSAAPVERGDEGAVLGASQVLRCCKAYSVGPDGGDGENPGGPAFLAAPAEGRTGGR